jgi:hypothetical protein
MGSFGTQRRAVLRVLTLLLGLGIGIPVSRAEMVLQKVPPLTVEQAPSYPQNLARIDLGAQIETDPKAEVSTSFLLGDPASAYPLKQGITTLLISLGKIENIDSIAFLNNEANGSLAIATASGRLPANSPQWHAAGEQELSTGLITAKIGPTEAKYVRLIFNVRAPGRIGALGVYSASAVADFTMPRSRKVVATNGADGMAKTSYNLADLHTKARAIFVSSGDDFRVANNMIDGQPGTAYAFAANDPAPAAIIDLGRSVPVNRISTFSTPGSAVVKFYVLGALPANNIGDPASALRIDPETLAAFKIVRTGSDDGSGRVAVNFKETTGRYVMLVWAPSTQNANFSVAEVAVFGPASSARLLAANTSSNNASDTSDHKNVRDFKDTKDFSKEIPGEGPAEEQAPAEGPAPELPRPPPFVFIPRVTPTSP